MEGGQGNVEILYDSINDCNYACKHLLDSSDSDAVARFLKEIKIIEKVNHPNIIKIRDSGTDSNGPYYCMPEYAANLRQYLQDELFHDYSKQYRILSQIISGLKVLHDNGIIHRDLKPENVLLNSYEDVVICDFGFSKDLTSDSVSLTITRDAFGTEGYISPEQFALCIFGVPAEPWLCTFGAIFVKVVPLRDFQPQWSGAERRLKISAAHFLRAVF